MPKLREIRLFFQRPKKDEISSGQLSKINNNIN